MEKKYIFAVFGAVLIIGGWATPLVCLMGPTPDPDRVRMEARGPAGQAVRDYVQTTRDFWPVLLPAIVASGIGVILLAISLIFHKAEQRQLRSLGRTSERSRRK
jgi:hypothetical protein